MTSRWDDRYWSIDVLGLDAKGASELVNHARTLPVVHSASAVNPDLWLTQHLDRDTVATLTQALSAAIQGTKLGSEEAWQIEQIVGDLRDWLESTETRESD